MSTQTEHPERLQAGQPAPDLTLPDADGREVSLAGLRGHRVILYFYPAAETPGCTTEACDFRDSLAELQAHGYTVLGVSKDAPAKLQRFREHHALSFPLLSDPGLDVHRAYGAYGTKRLYGREVQGVIRSTFVIDEQGIITLARYNVRAKGHVASLRRALEIPEV
jgi:peroxiredoxin Q/BCP